MHVLLPYCDMKYTAVDNSSAYERKNKVSVDNEASILFEVWKVEETSPGKHIHSVRMREERVKSHTQRIQPC